MQLPRAGSHYSACVGYGRYVARRLKRAGHEDLATDVLTATQAVRVAGRAWEDTDDLLQDALADRDASDDALDLIAKTTRNSLAGRSLDAVKTEPFTLIFPKGLAYYVAAPVSAETTRYNELAERLEQHLPASDALRRPTVHSIRAGVADYTHATDAYDKARRTEALATTSLLHARENWERHIEKVYGALVGEIGRAAADRFFPRIQNRAHTVDAPVDAPENAVTPTDTDATRKA